MIKISYPSYPFKIETKEDKEYIFDPLRKKWIRLTPEEWVRQNFLQYLIQVMQYPAGLIAIEKEIQIGELKKRFDILVYKDDRPWLLIECKEMNVPISESVMQQLLRYQITVQADYLIVTNGNETRGIGKENDQLVTLNAMPSYL
jgi:hypothetical protein